MDRLEALDKLLRKLGNEERILEKKIADGFKKSRELGQRGYHAEADALAKACESGREELKRLKEEITKIEPKVLRMTREKNRIR